jgi:hypothetical protein
MAETGAALREQIKSQSEVMSAAIRAECCGSAMKASRELSAELRAEMGAVQARLTSMTGALETQSRAMKELGCVARAAEMDSIERCDELKARLDLTQEETTSKVRGLNMTVQSLQAATEAAIAQMHVRSAGSDSAAVSLDEKRQSLRELSKSRLKSHLQGGSASTTALGSGYADGMADMGMSGTLSPTKGGGGLALEGVGQGLTALARVLGLVQDGEELGSGDWDWQNDVGRRLEQVWSARANEMVSKGRGNATDLAPLNASAHLFDILKQAAGNPQAAANGNVPLPDKREAARLQAWMAASGRTSFSGSQTSTPPNELQEEGLRPDAAIHHDATFRPAATFKPEAFFPARERTSSQAEPRQDASSVRPPRPPRPGSAGFGDRRASSASGLERSSQGPPSPHRSRR